MTFIMPLKLSLLNKYDDLSVPMLKFLDNAEKENIFSGSTWYDNFTENILQSEDKLYFYIVQDESTGEIIVILPCFCEHSNNNELKSLTNYYSSLYVPIVNKNHSEWKSGIRIIVKEIKKHKPLWHTVNFHPLPSNNKVIDELQKALKLEGFWVQRYFAFANWVYQINGISFDDYYQERPSRLKNTIKRKIKKLNKECEYSIQIYTTTDKLDELISDFERIYQLSWKQDEPYPNFVQGLIYKYAKKNQLRFGFLYVNGQAVASQIWFVTHGTVSIFKLAYDPSYKQYSTGSILTKELMRYVFENDKITSIDYLTGDDAYKRDWMSERNERIGLIGYNRRTLNGFIKGAYNILGKQMKLLLNH